MWYQVFHWRCRKGDTDTTIVTIEDLEVEDKIEDWRIVEKPTRKA